MVPNKFLIKVTTHANQDQNDNTLHKLNVKRNMKRNALTVTQMNDANNVHRYKIIKKAGTQIRDLH